MGMMYYRFPEEDRRGGMRRRGSDGRFRPSSEYRPSRMNGGGGMNGGGESYHYDDDFRFNRRDRERRYPENMDYRSRGGYRPRRFGEEEYRYYDDDDDDYDQAGPENEAMEQTYTDSKGREFAAVFIPAEYLDTVYAVIKTIEEPPETWDKYMAKDTGVNDIINMEIGELQTRMKDPKASDALLSRELKHVAAACLCKYKKINE